MYKRKNFISVIIPAYNEEDVIAKAINSVIKSTYKSYEIIIVNNGSTDKTKEIAEKFVKKNPKKIRLLSYKPDSSKEFIKRRGVAFSRNRGVEAASGDILFFLDSDDWVREDTLENIIRAFESHKGIDFICGDRKTVAPKSWRRIFLYYWITRKKNYKRPEKILYSGSYCPYIVKTKEFLKVGPFNERAYYREDIDFAMRLRKFNKPKLDTGNIVYYTDMGTHIKDYKRQCSNVAKSFFVYPFKSVGVFIQVFMFTLSFPATYFSMVSILLWRTGDIFVSIFSPFLWGMRRFLEIFHFFRLLIK